MRTSAIWLGLLGFALAASAQKRLEVVATLPDYGAIAQAIGGERVRVTTLARGTEDPHFVDARPSFVRVLNKADLLIEGGADLEAGWLSPLVAGARNKEIISGGRGNLKLATAVKLTDVPASADRSLGDVHPFGNPHFNLDPLNGKAMAGAIADKLAALAPTSAGLFRANHKKFIEELDRQVVDWQRRLEPLRGTKVITFHKSYDYFLHRFGLELAGTIEPKPGIEPSPTHINALVPRAKAQGVKFVIIEPNRSRRIPEYVANSIGARVLLLPGQVGGNEKIKTYFDLFEYAVDQLTNAR